MTKRSMTLAMGMMWMLGAVQPARAVVPAADDVPAATLLLPYFEVEKTVTATAGTSTMMTISNASASAVLAHVTIWTDAAIAVTNFNAYLTGYDQVSFDLHDVLVRGTYPPTASVGQDPGNLISPQGDLSQDINFASCTNQLPLEDLDAATLDHVQASLTGKASAFDGKCRGFDSGDDVLRGYVTVDTVNHCTLESPGTPGYFISGGVGSATNQNVLWGEWSITDRELKRTYASRLVPIEAMAPNPQTSNPGEYTFYARLVANLASDNREPLGAMFRAPYVKSGGPGFPASTKLIVWRDPKRAVTSFTCGANPVWYPLLQEEVVSWDDQEEHTAYTSPVFAPFPRATQIVEVGSAALPVPTSRGFLHLNLNTTVSGAGIPVEDVAAAQAWVEVVQEEADVGAYGVRGRRAITSPAMVLEHASETPHFPLVP